MKRVTGSILNATVLRIHNIMKDLKEIELIDPEFFEVVKPTIEGINTKLDTIGEDIDNLLKL